jgi:hypothetical protein
LLIDFALLGISIYRLVTVIRKGIASRYGGDIIKLRGHPKALDTALVPKGLISGTSGKLEGMVRTQEIIMGNPQPSPKGKTSFSIKVQSYGCCSQTKR